MVHGTRCTVHDLKTNVVLVVHLVPCTEHREDYLFLFFCCSLSMACCFR
jgi:hypothetical protein